MEGDNELTDMDYLIASIKVDRANFEHIAVSGNINGSLLVELRRILKELRCPYCLQGDFDKVGLKHHLENHCGNYKETESI
jgi:hypothetical protein